MLKTSLILAVLSLLFFYNSFKIRAEESMDQMWGSKPIAPKNLPPDQGRLFRDEKYAMFIHWGLYSSLGGKWKDKTCYGISEWIMNPRMAGISVPDYKALAKTFNPKKFDAKGIVQLAKDAGMKYVVITSKHHEGFAMFKSSDPFNIVDASPFGRDPMRELAEACRAAGLGFGFYYSHYQDWTAPGGYRGPEKNPDGSPASFDQYFKKKCYPQVEEICGNYGPLEVIWFDTPGKMPKEDVQAIHDLVRAKQPKALLGSRIGYGLGDYESHGDMEVPVEKVEGLWETCDTTNDSWGYSWYDANWKSSKNVLKRLVSTAARGGTYLLNVGLNGEGEVPSLCQQFLKKSGEWIKAHPEVVQKAGPSPYSYAMPWGDVTTAEDGSLNLVVFDLPRDGFLYLPGLKGEVKEVYGIVNGKKTPLLFNEVENAIRVKVPADWYDSLALLVKVVLKNKATVLSEIGIHPNTSNRLLVNFSQVKGAEKKNIRWMEKFGEWKSAMQVSEWTYQSKVEWVIQIIQPGAYHMGLCYSGKGRPVWKIENGHESFIQNQQGATEKYADYPIGILEFKKSGIYHLQVSLVDGDPHTSSLESVSLTHVE